MHIVYGFTEVLVRSSDYLAACDIEDEDDTTLENAKFRNELLGIMYADFEQHGLGLNNHLPTILCDVDHTWRN